MATTIQNCACGWRLHLDPQTGKVESLDIDQVRDLLNALGFDARDLLSVMVAPDQVTIRRYRTDANGNNASVVESVVTHR